MDALTLVNMALTALMVATLPAAMVWMSSDANKYRKLAWTCVFLIFDLIVFGGYTRLTDSGLGCPDWPGCYGTANPFLAHDAIQHAQALMPSGPVTLSKAWIEMIHRYLAMAIGVLIIALVAQSWRLWRKERRADYAPLLPTALLGFYCLQGVFGALTVTQKLQPIIVTGHLLLAMGLLSLTTWFASRQDTLHAPLRGSSGSPPAMRNIRLLADHVAALDGDARRRARQLIGLARIVGVLLDGRGQLFHRRGGLLQRAGLLLGARRQVLVAGGDLARRRRDQVGAAAHLADQRLQAVVHIAQRLDQLAGLAVRARFEIGR